MYYPVKKMLWLFLLALLWASCQKDEETTIDPQVTTTNPPNQNGNNGNNGNGNNNGSESPDDRLAALPLTIPQLANNPSSSLKIQLGRALFWDPVLSGERDVACATCHHPARGYTDGIDLSIGVGGTGFSQNRSVGYTGFVKRNAPTVINTAFNGMDEDGEVDPSMAEMFWDNRARSLEVQSLLPLHSFAEMRGEAYEEEETMAEVLARLQAIPEYRSMFASVFGNNNAITSENVAKALAVFERSILANNSPFDQYMRGNENALNNQQIRGMNAFVEVGCIECHNGPMFSDFDLHVLGVRDNPKLDESDLGNGNYAFRTPSLRNLEFTRPYMHNGEFNTLRQVLNFYDDHNNDSQNPNVRDNQLDRELRRLGNINRNERDAIIAFLESLNDPGFDRTIPQRVPSGLPVGGNIRNN